jgi:cell division control protein 42
MQNLKCVVVGESGVGKTCLVSTFHSKEFPTAYIPVVLDYCMVNVEADDTKICFAIMDTAGKESYDQLRQLAYEQTDVVLVCFSVNSSASFEKVKSRWISEVRKHCPTASVILVGTKSDLRANTEVTTQEGEKAVEKEEAIQFAKEIGAVEYLECSALNQEGLKHVFDRAVEIGWSNSKMKNKSSSSRSGCTLM